MSRRHHDTLDADVIVVGARCAGAATAMLLAAAGHDVLLVDRATFPSDTLSTHAIARSGVVQLKRWGLLPAVLATGAPPIRDVEFHVGESTIARTIKEQVGVDLLVAPRRSVLDALLVEEAQRAGARLMTGVQRGLRATRRDGRVNGVLGSSDDGRVDLRSRFVVGADGLRSRVARLVGAPYTEVRRAGSGAAHYAYFAGRLASDGVLPRRPQLRRDLPDEQRRGLRLGVLSVRGRRAVRRWHGSVDDALMAMLRLAAPELARRVTTTARQTSRSRVDHRQPNYLRHPIGPRLGAGRRRRLPPRRRSLATGSATPSATPSCWRGARPSPARMRRREPARSAAYSRRARRPATRDLRDHVQARDVPARGSLHRAAEAARPEPSTPRPTRSPAARCLSALCLSGVRPPNPPVDRPTHERNHHDHHRNPIDTERRRHGHAVRHPGRREAGAPAAQFQFRAHNQWVSGTHNRSTIDGFFGVGEEQAARAHVRVRRRPPGRARRQGQRPDPGRVRAAQPRRLPHRGPGEHRRRPQGHADRGPLDRHAATST